ncbi:MAG: CapA family protein [Myxococcales bacterium]|nr:CapA family protein [Myxococcales bacterium]
MRSSVLPLSVLVLASAATVAAGFFSPPRRAPGAVAVAVAVAPRPRARLVSPRVRASSRPALELTFVGDVIFGRYRRQGFYDPIVARGVNPFAEVASLLASDLAVANLETPLTWRLAPARREALSMRFTASARAARTLVGGGFGAVSVANNHAWDAGERGLVETPRILRRAGVTPLGSGELSVQLLERRGYRIAFVALTTHGPPGGRGVAHVRLDHVARRAAPLLARARRDADVVVVSVHWGEEYADAPTGFRRSVAYRLVDAGADLVIGHHPHVLQAIERRRGALIAYSLGNFLFENVHAVPRLSGVLRVRFERPHCIARAKLHPVYIRREPRAPAPARAAIGERVRRRVQQLSRRLGTRWSRDGEDLALSLSVCGL